MGKKLIAFGLLGMVLFSCSDQSEEYSTAAEQLCTCMEENADSIGDISDLKMKIGVCLLDSKVDLKDQQMLTQIEEKCPEIKGAFEEFVNGI